MPTRKVQAKESRVFSLLAPQTVGAALRAWREKSGDEAPLHYERKG